MGNSLIDSGHPKAWKFRRGPAGLHLFNRYTGLSVLMDDIAFPVELHSRAPRQVSIALTNRCDLACVHCYAPKTRDELRFDTITRWLAELDANGTLGVGFGGGEPTLYPEFVKLCRHVANVTTLSVSFTTHGHHINNALADQLRGCVNFIRVSMDGVGATYESIRRRSFSALLKRLQCVRYISRFGINVVVNDLTLPGLDDLSNAAADAGACELLLLPQMATRRVEAISVTGLARLRRWVESYSGPLQLSISDGGAPGFPICDPLVEEHGLHAYAHIDAMGVLKRSSYDETGIHVGEGTVIEAIHQLSHAHGESAL